MIIDVLNYLVAIVTVILAYRFFVERTKNGKKMSDIKGLFYSLLSCLVLLWVINVFIGFVR